MNSQEVIAFGKGIGDPTRLRILALLVKFGSLCVCELGDALEVAQSSLSTHLQTLRSTGLVITEKNHRWIEYAVDPKWLDLVSQVVGELAPEMEHRLTRDLVRMEIRLKLRSNNCCSEGFGALRNYEKEVELRVMNECQCGCCSGTCNCGCCKGK